MAKPAERNKKSRREGKRAYKIASLMLKEYPEAKTALKHRSALQLLVATILSAQSTDVRVNIVTKGLFSKYKTAAEFAKANHSELEQEIRSTGFFRQKARSIIECCRDIVEKHGGRVPDTMEGLIALRGVGRKTANVVLGNFFGKPVVVVDRHVKRLSERLGLTSNANPDLIEQDLMRLLPEELWRPFSDALILHGRAVCEARKPRCCKCVVASLCPSVNC
ncbi:MAG: endonuclease III [Candidatus Eisenbacteria bacterium]|nr:endonuclease III [Candidatus Eisenbacteria bacterium]